MSESFSINGPVDEKYDFADALNPVQAPRVNPDKGLKLFQIRHFMELGDTVEIDGVHGNAICCFTFVRAYTGQFKINQYTWDEQEDKWYHSQIAKIEDFDTAKAEFEKCKTSLIAY